MAIHLKSQHVTNMYTPIELVSTGIRYIRDGGGGGVTDHGYLHGLADDDHPQYMHTSQSSLYMTGGINTTNFLNTGATVSFVHTSNSSEFIANSNSVAFALTDHSHTDILESSVLASYALSDHSHGSVNTVSITGSNITLVSASTGLEMGVPNYLTTAYGAAIQGDGSYSQNTGTIQFANSNGVTFGLSDNGVMTASIPAIGGAQTGVSGIYDGVGSGLTAGSITFGNHNGLSFVLTGSEMQGSFSTLSFVNSNNITFGVSESSLTASYSQSLQTSNVHNVTIDGNKTSVGDGYIHISSGTLTLAGGSNITLSQNGNAITIIGSAGVSNSHNVSISGNTSGTQTEVSSGTLYLAGGNNITLSQNGNSITISGANLGGAQTGISGIGVSNTTYSSGTIIWSAQNNITLGTSSDGASQYVRVSVGNYLTTAANSTHTHGNVSLSLTNISGSASMASNGLTISLTGVNPSNFINTSDSTRFVKAGFSTQSTAGSDMVGTNNSLGLNVGIPKWLTTAAQISHVHGSASMNISNLTGNISSLSNGITVNLTGFEGGDFLQTDQIGTIYFGGGSNITWDSSVSSNSTTIMATAGGGSGGTGGIVMNISGNTSGTTALISSGTARLAGGDNITLSQEGNSITIVGGIGGVNTGFTSTAITGANVAGTLDSLGLNLAVPNYLTTAMLSSMTANFAGTGYSTRTTSGSLVGLTYNTAGLTIAIPNYLTTTPVANIYFQDSNGHSWSSSVSGASTTVFIRT